MKQAIKRRASRLRRKRSIRKRVNGTATRPRMSVFRSSKHIYAQVVDDVTGVTLAAASTVDKEIRGEVGELKKSEAAALVGKKLAERCKAKNIDQVFFDRGGFIYHGRVASLADGAREGGLVF